MLKVQALRTASSFLALTMLQSFEPAVAQAAEQRAAHTFFLDALPRGGATYDEQDFSEYQGRACKSEFRFGSVSLVLDWTQMTDVSQTISLGGGPDGHDAHNVKLVGKVGAKVTNLTIKFKSENIAGRITGAFRELIRSCDPLKGSGF